VEVRPVAQNATDSMLDRQIGQLFMVGSPATEPDPAVVELIEHHHVGGIILFSRNITSAPQVLDLTSRLQAVARAAGHPAPLLIATDQENGVVRRLGPDATTFPGNMALGAAASDELTHDVARATGEELRAVGVNMNLAPSVDVNNNQANPVIGVRSFGEDPRLVARLGAEAVRGFRASRVISTLKHFPGHGDTAVDSHRALPTIAVSPERLDAMELVPFRAGIAAGADAVMVGHIYLPALMPGPPEPATFSPEVITGLLRRQLGFGGLVITDCLEMEAVVRTVGVAQGAVLALQAGADLVLVSHRPERQRAAIEAVRAAVHAGELSTARIHEAAERVARLKRDYLSWDALPSPAGLSAVGSPAHLRLRDAAYARTTTVVRDEGHLLPLRLAPAHSLLIVASHTGAITLAADVTYRSAALVEALRPFHANLTALTVTSAPGSTDPTPLVNAVAAADATLFVTLNAHLDPEQQALVRSLAPAARMALGLAVNNPYDALALPALRTYLATYEYSEPALAAAARVLFGQAPATGCAPVTLTPAGYPAK
jgi:beta-N-acetylhexosaminidase